MNVGGNEDPRDAGRKNPTALAGIIGFFLLRIDPTGSYRAKDDAAVAS